MAKVLLWGWPVPVSVEEAWRAGEPTTSLLRPESVELTPAGGAGGARGTVRACTFLGETIEYQVDVDGTVVQAVAYNPMRRGVLEVGAPVAADCGPAALRLVREVASSSEAR